VLTVTLTKGGSATVDLAQLSVASKDQYGAPLRRAGNKTAYLEVESIRRNFAEPELDNHELPDAR